MKRSKSISIRVRERERIRVSKRERVRERTNVIYNPPIPPQGAAPVLDVGAKARDARCARRTGGNPDIPSAGSRRQPEQGVGILTERYLTAADGRAENAVSLRKTQACQCVHDL